MLINHIISNTCNTGNSPALTRRVSTRCLFKEGVCKNGIYKGLLKELDFKGRLTNRKRLTQQQSVVYRRMLEIAHYHRPGYCDLSKSMLPYKSDDLDRAKLVDHENLARTFRHLEKKGYIKTYARSRKWGGDASNLMVFLDQNLQPFAYDEVAAFAYFPKAKYHNESKEKGNRKRGRPHGSTSVKLNRGGGVKMTYVVEKYNIFQSGAERVDGVVETHDLHRLPNPPICPLIKSDLQIEAERLTGNLQPEPKTGMVSLQDFGYLSDLAALMDTKEPSIGKDTSGHSKRDPGALKQVLRSGVASTPPTANKFHTFDQIAESQDLMSHFSQKERVQLEDAIRKLKKSTAMVRENLLIVRGRLLQKPIQKIGGYTLCAIRDDWAHYDWEPSRMKRAEKQLAKA